MSPPKDRFHLAFTFALVLGLIQVLPWNSLSMAQNYFQNYKLVSNETAGNVTAIANYRAAFMEHLSTASMLPLLVCNGLNVLVSVCGAKGGGLKWEKCRVIVPLCAMLLIFCVHGAFAVIDTSRWPYGFFQFTIWSAVILNLVCGVYSSSLFGIFAPFPASYINALIFGNNICGSLVALVGVGSVLLAPSAKLVGLASFAVSAALVALAGSGFCALPLFPFYRYYSVPTCAPSESAPLVRIVAQVSPHMTAVFCVFLATIGCYPAVQCAIKSTSIGASVLGAKLWVPVGVFLHFNVLAFAGNVAAQFVQWPNAKWCWVACVARASFFFPFFLLCNYWPEGVTARGLPVVVANDYIYLCGAAVFAFTSGYLSSLAMMYAPQSVAPRYAPAAGMLASFALVCGLVAGAFASSLMRYAVLL